jgi:tetratricopeptide (TPR) repeat protein
MNHVPAMTRLLSNPAMPALARIQVHHACVEAEGYLELGMPQQALRTLQHRRHLVHGDARGCYLMGESLRELERYREAVFPLRRSLELIPDDVHVAMALGWCYKRIGKLDDAIAALERAVSIEPGDATLHYNLACYWSLARNRRRALQHLAYALDIDGNYRKLAEDEPDFDNIRHDPLFQSLTAALG